MGENGRKLQLHTVLIHYGLERFSYCLAILMRCLDTLTMEGATIILMLDTSMLCVVYSILKLRPGSCSELLIITTLIHPILGIICEVDTLPNGRYDAVMKLIPTLPS